MFEMDAQFRIETIDRALDSLEEFFPHARDQAFLRKRQELKSCRNHSDRELIESELDVMTMEWSGHFPAYFYGSILVLLWSEVEAVILRFASEVRSVKEISLSLDEVVGSSAYSRLRKYVEAVMGVSLPDNSVLEDLHFLRNLYAHHGGDLAHETPVRMKRIEAIMLARAGVTKVEDFLLVDAAYLRHARDCALELVKLLRSIHPSPEPSLVELPVAI